MILKIKERKQTTQNTSSHIPLPHAAPISQVFLVFRTDTELAQVRNKMVANEWGATAKMVGHLRNV